MPVLTLKVNDSLLRKVEHAAGDRHATKSAIIRKALNEYLDGDSSTAAESSSFDLVKRFSGKVNGPADLSHDSRHMEGYGK